MAKKKKKVEKTPRRGNSDKIKEAQDMIPEIESKRQEKRNRLNQIKDNKDEQSLQEVDEILDELNELDKKERWAGDREKMIKNFDR